MNNKTLLENLINSITPPDEGARLEARSNWNNCAKPLGGLGLLETALEDIAALTGSPAIDLGKKAALIFCADNGVVSRGVTQTDSSVTAAVAANLALGRTSVCRMAAVAGCEVLPVDMGILDFPLTAGVISSRIRNGTGDISVGPAMSEEEAAAAILTGADLVRQLKEDGVKLIAAGEMGIGNTTTSAAVICALTGAGSKEIAGRGAGLSDEGLRRKINAINNALTVNKPDPKDPVDVLAKVGGLDIAGMCGAFLGGAAYRVPILIDGVISSAAALCALRLCPDAKKAMLASHVSAEPAGPFLLGLLGKEPLITAGMHLGEGTGAVAAMPLLDMALAVYRESYTFAEGGIEPYTPQG